MGEFAYLAHISANDRIYGGDNTDLLSLIKKRIDYLDLPEAQKRFLPIAIISPRPQYTVNIVDALTDWGVFLAQIRPVFDEQARHANLSHDFQTGRTVVEWAGYRLADRKEAAGQGRVEIDRAGHACSGSRMRTLVYSPSTLSNSRLP